MGVLEENWNNRGLFLLCECFLSFRGFSVLLSVDRGNLWIAVRRIGIFKFWFFDHFLVISWFFSFSFYVCVDRRNLWIAVRKIGILELCFFVDQWMLLVISWFFRSPLCVCRSKFVNNCIIGIFCFIMSQRMLLVIFQVSSPYISYKFVALFCRELE